MASLEDLVRLKTALAARLVAEGLQGRVVHRAWAWSPTVAAAAAATNVHAVGVGRKVVNGRPTRTWAVRLHVAQKLPESLLGGDARLPNMVDGLPTDVGVVVPIVYKGD
jgi:steroid 5-alpha reductase family enzyme